MTTSHVPIPPAAATLPRGPLRLRMAEHPGRGLLDGGWWPRSRDLAVELADLIDHFPGRFCRILRAVYSPPDWDPAPRRIPTARGSVKVDSFPRDDTHVIELKSSDMNVLRVLVVPPRFRREHGEAALSAAADSGNTHPATALLEGIAGDPDVAPVDHWNDDGGSWWDPHPIAPSFRTTT